MEANVKNKLKELAEALSASEAYQAVKAARAQMNEHQAAQVMLRDLQVKQQIITERFERGEQPTEAEMADFERTAEMVGFNPYIRQLFEAEVALSAMLNEIQREIARAVGIELKSPLNPDEEESADASGHGQVNDPPPTSKRLWTPGS